MGAVVRYTEAAYSIQFLVQAGILGALHGRVALVDRFKGIRADQVGGWSRRGDIGVFRRGAPVALKLGTGMAPVLLAGEECRLGPE